MLARVLGINLSLCLSVRMCQKRAGFVQCSDTIPACDKRLFLGLSYATTVFKENSGISKYKSTPVSDFFSKFWTYKNFSTVRSPSPSTVNRMRSLTRGRTDNFSSIPFFDRKERSMTLTSDDHMDTLNQRVRYLGRRPFGSKVIVWLCTQTDTNAQIRSIALSEPSK